MPDRSDACRDAEVAHLADRQAQREVREKALLEEAVVAGLEAMSAVTGESIDVRVLVVAMFGDPFAGDDEHPEGGRSVPIRASFASLDAARPTTDAQKRYLALEGIRSASFGLFREINLGLALADALEDLAARAEAGDEEARKQHSIILDAVKREEADGAAADLQDPARHTDEPGDLSG